MEYNDAIKNRLRRAEGQIKGVLNMMENEKDCRDIVSQLNAIRSAVDRVIGLVVANNLESCIRTGIETGSSSEDAIQEAVNLIVKSR